jgi:hypothetical protein
LLRDSEPRPKCRFTRSTHRSRQIHRRARLRFNHLSLPVHVRTKLLDNKQGQHILRWSSHSTILSSHGIGNTPLSELWGFRVPINHVPP